MDRGAWPATAHEVAEESDMTERLNSNMISKSIPIAAGAWFCVFNLWLSFLKVLSGANIDLEHQ